MPPLTQAAALQIIDSIAIVLIQAYQLARSRIASAASPVLRMLAERDHYHMELALQRRETEIIRGQRANMPAVDQNMLSASGCVMGNKLMRHHRHPNRLFWPRLGLSSPFPDANPPLGLEIRGDVILVLEWPDGGVR